MPLVGFSLMFLGGLLAYSGYLGQSPATVVKTVFAGEKMPPRIPLDPNAAGTANTTAASSQSDQGTLSA